MRVRIGIGIGVGLAVPVMILLGEGIKVDLTGNTNIVNGDGNVNIADGGGNSNFFVEDSITGATLARVPGVPTMSFELTLPGEPSDCVKPEQAAKVETGAGAGGNGR